jgi:hypothetical protein
MVILYYRLKEFMSSLVLMLLINPLNYHSIEYNTLRLLLLLLFLCFKDVLIHLTKINSIYHILSYIYLTMLILD